MNIKRLISNTVATLIALTLIFGGFSTAFAQEIVPNSNFTGFGDTDLSHNLTRPIGAGGAIGTDVNAGMGATTGLNADANLTNSALTIGSDGTLKPRNGAETQASTFQNPGQTTAGQNTANANGTPNTGTASYKSITSNVLGCSVGQLLASIITSGITAALNGLANLLGVWVGAPVHDAQANNTLGFQTATAHGFQIFGVYVGVSLDSIAYCIINSILEYIANATIAWANSGFNGNPAFIQNPERFFQGLADQQAASFINALAYNTKTGAGGAAMNVCQPFRTNVAVGLASAYGRQNNSTVGNAGYANYGSCGLSATAQDNFYNGKSNKGMLTNMYYASQFDNNTAIGSWMMSGNYMRGMQAQKNAAATQEASWGNGWLSSKVCANPNDPNSCNTVVPGNTINSKVNNTLSSGQNRLVNATKFDQVVTAIVNNLIRVALNKLLAPIGLGVPAGTNFTGTSYAQTGTGVNGTTIYNAQGVPYTGTPPAGVQGYTASGKPIPMPATAQ